MASKSHVLKLDMGKGSGFPRVEFTNCRSYVSKAPRWNHVKKNWRNFRGCGFLWMPFISCREHWISCCNHNQYGNIYIFVTKILIYTCRIEFFSNVLCCSYSWNSGVDRSGKRGRRKTRMAKTKTKFCAGGARKFWTLPTQKMIL